jgi:two-component system OmpR family response regulator
VRLAAYVVDDNSDLRETLAGALQELTCLDVVGSASSETEAREWFDGHPEDWDIAILDLFLRTGSGIPLLRGLQRRRPHQKIVVFSNFINPLVRKRCAQLGADAVFDKSTDLDALVDYCAAQCARVTA